MLKELKKFLLRGNVVDLAVGVIIGTAFGTVVSSLVSDILTPFISALVKIPDFKGLAFSINGSQFMYGHFLNALISFLLVGLAVFFGVVTPMNYLFSRSRKEEPIEPTTRKCPECLSEIPKDAKRCAHCAQIVK